MSMCTCISIRGLCQLLGQRTPGRALLRQRLDAGDEALPAHASAGAHKAGCFAVTAIALSAESKRVTNLQPDSRLSDLKCLVGQAFGVPNAQVQLILGTRMFTTAENSSTLRSLGVGEGSEVTFVRQRFLQMVAGMRIELCSGGTEAVNGTYLCCPKENSHGDGSLVLRQEGTGPRHWIAWWKSQPGSWPSGWFVEEDNYHASYYHPSENSSELPPDLWEVYTQKFSKPGAIPVPGLRPV